jgi:phosphoglycolate phosphatase-like HAD superfamily hydrolase
MSGEDYIRLVLFDIDGTILYTGGAGRRAMRRALLQVFGATGPIKGFPFAGKTDPQIIVELMSLAGYAQELIRRRLADFWEHYVEYLEEEMSGSDGLVVYPGVADLIRALQDSDGTILGLQTGNIQRGARIKLEPTGLNPFFPVGAFGDDSRNRNELPRIAVQRVRKQFGKAFRGTEVIIVGDTPADVACARHFGARAVAVATGFHDRQGLVDSRPDALFEDFRDTKKVLEAILE